MKCTILAIIPARGGSKRIPRKNIRLFAGQPIIKYSIDAAFQTGCFDEVMVSTDDDEVARVAEQNGACIPFMRSEQNSNDYAGLAEVIEEVLIAYQKMGREFTYFCCVLPTAPFVSGHRLLQGLQMLKTTGADAVIPVVRFSYPIQRAFMIENSQLKMMWPENYIKRSQDLMPAFHDCGQFYWMNVQSFLEQKKIFAHYTVPLEIQESEVQDIDVEEDWKIAEWKYKALNPFVERN